MLVAWLSYDKQIPAYCKIIWEFGGTDQGEKMQQKFKGTFPVFWPRVLGTSNSFIELLELQ